jgi:hypothetical protein
MSAIQIWKLLADFHEMCYVSYATGGYVNDAVYNLLQTITTRRTRKFHVVEATVALISSESWNNE